MRASMEFHDYDIQMSDEGVQIVDTMTHESLILDIGDLEHLFEVRRLRGEE